MLIYVNCVEVHPHWVWGIGQAPGRKCICCKQKTELTGCIWYGNRDQGQKTEPEENWEERDRKDCQCSSSCQAGCKPLNVSEDRVSPPGSQHRQSERNNESDDEPYISSGQEIAQQE